MGSSFLFSLIAMSRGYSLAVAHGLLVEEASLVVKQRLEDVQASVVAAYGLSSCGAPA